MIFVNHYVPLMWKQSIIYPIFKGGQKDKKDPLSYRPISLISNPCKIFSSILNDRLTKYMEHNCVLVEEQNGFRKNRSCLDHIFVLSSILRSRLVEKKSTFACFVDFSKAFDFVNRKLLMVALKNIGIQGNFLSIYESMYSKTEATVRLNDNMTKWFTTEAGVRQGQNDSPTAFAIFINSLAITLKNLNLGIKYGNIVITILLYADDIIILAETEESLQVMLNELAAWCTKWRMLINSEKSQIIHFRPKRCKKTNYKFTLDLNTLEIVDKYRYLGCTINEHLDSTATGNKQAEGAARALGKLLSKYHSNKGLGYNTYKKLFDSCIAPIMDYGSSVWGYASNDKLNRIQNRAMRCFLGVNKYAPLAGIEGDMAWTTSNIRRKLHMLRYWNRIMSLDNVRLPKQIYNIMMDKGHPWLTEVRNIFESINANDVFQNNIPILNFKTFSHYASDMLMKQYINIEWSPILRLKPKLDLYCKIKTDYIPENYCNITLKKRHRSLLAKLRLGVLPINLELGRYKQIPRNERWCPLCKTNKIENEFHIIFECPVYDPERCNLLHHAENINKEFRNLNRIGQFSFLTTNVKVLRKTACFLSYVLLKRQQETRILL